MTRLLAVDTTTDVCSVALDCEAGGVFEHSRLAPRLHNRHLLEMIDGVVQAASIARTDLDFIAFGAGPGSFTGVRIGAAVAQGIAFAADAKIVRVPSSAVTAEAARRAGLRGDFSIRRKSKPGWHYRAQYQLADDRAECLSFDELTSADDSVATVDGDLFPVHARLVAELARQRIDEAVAAAGALPFYVDGDNPWRTRT